MKIVVIGAGTMGSVHAPSYAAMAGVELVGIVDPRTEVVEALAARTGTKAYATYDEFLLERDSDVVDICVPTPFHRGYIERAAKRGKHVVCEKPLALSLADAEADIKVCRENNVRLFVGQVVRFFPEYRKIYAAVQEGALGRVGTARTFRGGAFPTASNDWYANAHMSGTLVTDMMIHDFDFLRWCFGDVERVYAKSLMPYEANRIDHALVSLRFQNGVIAHAEGTWAMPAGFHTAIEVAGCEGMLTHSSDDTAPIHLSRRETSAGGGVVEVPSSPLVHHPYYRELAHFIDCIRTGQPADVEPEDALEALRISLAAMESIRTGRVVRPLAAQKGSVGA